MANNKPYYCETCDSTEQHRQLSNSEKTWLKGQIHVRNVDAYIMCVREGCRNLRTGWDKRPFTPPLRVPPHP
ncbi:hypothetical protein [Streptomyces spiramyceticus]|uniref:hypothetical protein n=1 Tax=Streptomyces spiramyceticus TaxID=299717 RepID=UPI00237A69FE|nr:hypothetical protein [Streptomyces spiramyceticus]